MKQLPEKTAQSNRADMEPQTEARSTIPQTTLGKSLHPVGKILQTKKTRGCATKFRSPTLAEPDGIGDAAGVPQFHTIEEVGALLKKSHSTINSELAKGKFSAIKVGRRTLIAADSVKQYIAAAPLAKYKKPTE